MSTSHKYKLRIGRPRKAEGPRYDCAELDRLLVFGEPEIDPTTGLEIVRYPTYREIADRLGIGSTAVHGFAKAHRCLERREEIRATTRAAAEKKLVELRSESFAVTQNDTVHVLDMCIVSFFQALEEGRVRCTSIADLNTVVRLKQLLVGDADSRSDVRGTITLEEIQARYRAMRERMASETPALCGMAPRARAAAPSQASVAPDEGPPSGPSNEDGSDEPESSGTPPVAQ